MKKRVYCENCKHMGWLGCKDLHRAEIIERNYYWENKFTSQDAYYKNKDNNCKWFEAK